MNNRLLATLIAGFVVSGCSGEKADGSAPAAARAPAEAGADAVAAVLQSAGTPIAKLGFALVVRPVVGAQSELRLDLSSLAAVPVLEIRAEAQNITLDPATALASVAIGAGQTVSHQVRLTPQREGLTEITVRLRADPGSTETVYLIPVLVAATAAGG